MNRTLTFLSATLLMLGASACSNTGVNATGDAYSERQYAQVLENSWQEIHHLFHEMHEGIEAASERLGSTGVEGEQATQVLEGLCGANSHAFDCATVDANGVIVAIAPKEFSHFIGADISDQEQIKRLHATREAVVSQAIDTIEGFQGFDFEHPVFAESGEFIGSVSILTEPHFFGKVIVPTVKDHPVEMWMMQMDGRIFYDTNPEEIGRNLFEDEIYSQYPSLVAVGREMVESKEGSGQYRFLDKTMNATVEKRLLWKTIELHGTEFRLALSHVVDE